MTNNNKPCSPLTSADQALKAQLDELAKALSQVERLPHSTYAEQHSLAAHQAKAPPAPTASAPDDVRLAYWKHQQQEAQGWADAFELRASSANNEAAKQESQQLACQWRDQQLKASAELRRLRDAIAKRKTRGEPH